MKHTNTRQRRLAMLGIAILATAFHANTVNAQDINYNIPGSSNYIGTTVSGTRLIVGDDQADVSLFVTNGGLVEVSLRATVSNDSNATNSLLQVEDGGIVLVGNTTTNGFSGNATIAVGDTDGVGELTVEYDSETKTEDMYVGRLADEIGKVTLQNGGQLSVSGMLAVGATNNTGNLITVADGGRLAVGHETNIVINTGTDDSNKINVNSGGALLVRGDVDATSITDRTNINFSAGAILGAGGDFSIDNNAIEDSLNILLDNDLSTNHTAQWITDAIYIGENSSNNSLTLTNGAQASATGSAYIGDETTAKGNGLQVSGSNSMFTAGNNLFVGKKGDSNTLLIDDGGQVEVGQDLVIGSSSEASQNTATITGTNSQLTVSSNIVVGANGGNNTFNIDHGNVSVSNNFILGSSSANNRYNQTGGTNTVAGEFIIGKTENATGETGFVDNDSVETTGNLALVGTNAVLNIEQNLTVGQEGGGSIMTIRDGGIVNVASNVVIGESVGDNYIYLQRDSNTLFNVSGDLVVGKEGGSNRFAVYGGTANIDGNLYMGASTNQHDVKNFIHLETTNAVLNVANGMYIGASNSINTLDLVGGAKASVQDLFVGAYDGVSNNVVTVTGTDSLLSVSNRLEIGSNSGSNNAVNIDNGGALFVLNPTNIVIGATATNDLNNRLNINSGGTLHTIDWDYTSVSTNIALNNGSTLELDGIFSGTNQLDGGIELALNGISAATNWNTGTDVLRVGYQTGGNTLTLMEGGLATTTTNLIVGSSSKSANNTLTATGLAARVEVGNNLIVGNTGSLGNAVKVLGGGRVDVGNDMILGYKSGFNSGSLIEGFEGSNSVLEIAGKLTIGSGENGNNNTLNLSSNALVNVGDSATVGNNTSGNTLNLSGSNSVFNIGNNLVVGSNEGSGNAMGIANGGTVNVATNLTLGAGGSGNTISLRGLEDALSSLNITNNLTIGSNGGDGNTFTISSNATVNVFNLATIGSSANNNTLNLEGTNAMLNVGSNLLVGAKTATGNKLEIKQGTANIDNSLIIGSNSNSANNTVVVSGSNSTLNVGSNLTVGNDGAGNSLYVTNGATAHVAGDAWIGLNSANNRIEARGSNAWLYIDNNMYVGSTNEASSGNRLGVYEAANIFVGGNLVLAANGTVEIDYDAQIEVGENYAQDEFSTLSVRVSTNSATTNLVVDGTANFEKDTTIAVISDGTIGDLVDEDGNTNEIERTIVAAGSLKIDEQDATTALLRSSINFQTNALLGFSYTVTNNTILLDNFIKRSWADAAGLEGMLAKVAKEIEDMAAVSNELAQSMDVIFQSGMTGQEINKTMNDYYGEKTSSAPVHNVINQGIGSIASELTVRGDNTRDRITAPVPDGAAGPHRWNQPLQGWIAGYGTMGSKSEASGFDGYDVSLGGFIIGADFAASENLLLGVAGGSNSGNADKDNGADGDTKTTYGAVYASIGTKDWFLDGSVIYGTSSIDYTMGSVFDTTASYDAKNIAVYLGGGKEIVGQYLIITPQASLLANQYEQDAYDEKSSNAVTRSVEGFDALYLQSSLGCSLGFYSAMGNTIVKPELRVHWLHEFNDDEESLSYLLIGGNGGSYNMLLQAPDADILKLGAGFAAKMSDYLELRADIDARLSAEYSDYTFSGSLRYQF